MSEKTYTGATHSEELDEANLDQVTGGNNDIVNLANTIATTIENVNHMALELR